MVNKYTPHVFVIPEDDRDRQIADGFVQHPQVQDSRIQVVPPAGGWPKVLKTFEDEYIPYLRKYVDAHVVMLIDFDNKIESRRATFDGAIPLDLKERVFVVGSRDEPETLKQALARDLEGIGSLLADDCDGGTLNYWAHDELQHNDAERARLVQAVKPFLF